MPNNDISLEYLTCKTCGAHFDNLADMQRHTLVEHFQKGDIPSKEKND
ncbi:MAG TPA: hypothetical protein VFD60_13370 [Nitrososphaeraceae archaeon]|nr:hypothetical protein [Nitrososphaeraceae archaeon]